MAREKDVRRKSEQDSGLNSRHLFDALAGIYVYVMSFCFAFVVQCLTQMFALPFMCIFLENFRPFASAVAVGVLLFCGKEPLFFQLMALRSVRCLP